jgi:hypothetical protein
MPANARVTDLWVGVCVCHRRPRVRAMAGVIIVGSFDTLTNNLPQARVLDMTIGFCGHPGVIITGSENTFVNNRSVARVTDAVIGCNIGIIVTGSPNVYTNG